MRTTLTVLAVSVLAADEIHLADGRVLDGVVLSHGATAVLRIRAAGISAEIQVPTNDILRIVPGLTKAEQARQAFFAKRESLTAADQASPQPVSAWWSLAQEAKAADEPKAMRDLARVVIARDPEHAGARAMLGQVQQDGRWMTPDEAAVARGEVWFRGRWTALAVRDAILAEEARASSEASARLAQMRAERIESAAYTTTAAAPSTQIYIGTTTFIPLAPIYYPYPRPLPACQPSGLMLQASGSRPGFAWNLTYR